MFGPTPTTQKNVFVFNWKQSVVKRKKEEKKRETKEQPENKFSVKGLAKRFSMLNKVLVALKKKSERRK